MTYAHSGRVTLQDLVKVHVADVLLKTRGQARVHTSTTRKNNVVVEFAADVDVSLLDALEQLVGHSG